MPAAEGEEFVLFVSGVSLVLVEFTLFPLSYYRRILLFRAKGFAGAKGFEGRGLREAVPRKRSFFILGGRNFLIFGTLPHDKTYFSFSGGWNFLIFEILPHDKSDSSFSWGPIDFLSKISAPRN